MSSKKKKKHHGVVTIKQYSLQTNWHHPRVKLIAPFKNQQKQYELDRIANEMGHGGIRLSPYHCQYNPIELIWAKVKGEVAGCQHR